MVSLPTRATPPNLEGPCPHTDGTTAPTDPPATPDPMDFADTNWQVVSFGLDGADDTVLPNAVPTIRFGRRRVHSRRHHGLQLLLRDRRLLRRDRHRLLRPRPGPRWPAWTMASWTRSNASSRPFARIDGFSLSDGSLVLDAADGSAVIRSEALPPGSTLPLAGAWRLTTFVDEDVAMSVLAGTEITMTLDPDAGTISGHAGCNGFNGGITVDTGAGRSACNHRRRPSRHHPDGL